MNRAQSLSGHGLNTPIGWNMVPDQAVTNEEFLYVMGKNGFKNLPDMITWEQYKSVIHAYFPNRIRGEVCKRCLGASRACIRCNGIGLEKAS